jgi:hypothetical protein
MDLEVILLAKMVHQHHFIYVMFRHRFVPSNMYRHYWIRPRPPPPPPWDEPPPPDVPPPPPAETV